MAFLKILSGDLKGHRFEIDRDEVVIGRAPDNVVLLDDPSVSGKHCMVVRDGRKYSIRDLGSTNGTRLNDARISEYRLSPKDVIMAGSVEILFDGDDIDVSDDSSSIADTVVGFPVRSQTDTKISYADSPSPFAARRSSKGVWILATILLALAALAALGWFIVNLFKS